MTKAGMTKQGVRDRGRDPITPSSQLVIGYSEQHPNDLRAYRLMGTSTDGGVLLSRQGRTYSAAREEVADHGEMLERMLGLVLKNLPLDFRPRARAVLTRRWNRDWGVEAEDLIQAAAVGDRQGARANGADFATEPFETSSSPVGPFQPKVSGDGFFEPQAALADSQRSGTHG